MMLVYIAGRESEQETACDKDDRKKQIVKRKKVLLVLSDK